MPVNTDNDANVPMRSQRISWGEFLEVTGCHPSRLGELIEMGWLEPETPSVDSVTELYLFRVGDVYRVRKLERLCQDFELTSLGASIIVDLLLRIDVLQAKVRDLETLNR